MRFQSTFALTAALALVFLPGVQAQQNNTPTASKKPAQGFPPGNPFAPGSPLGSQLGPLVMGFGSMFGGIVDPTHSNALNLLQRNDVRSELLLTSQQREKLDEMKANSQQELMGRVMTSASENFQGIQNAPPEQRLELVQAGLGKIQDTLVTYQDELDKRFDKLLNQKATGGLAQMERLRQLDLQWRGPLALSEKKLADPIKLTPDQRTKITAALSDYMQAQTEAMTNAFTDVRNNVAGATNASGKTPGAAGQAPPFNPQDMQKRMMEAMQTDEVKKAKKTAEKKVLDLLTPDQKESWNSGLGKPFAFRANDN